ncbi:MAG: glycosyltransferase family 2 protein [Frankiaceae bacterium]|nr:glycosyltransferase family 2 protein [Arenimonas sp.]
MTALSLPSVIVPVSRSAAVLDACLAALEQTLPGTAHVLIADHAASDPFAEALARRWCDRSRLDAEYCKSDQALTLSENINHAIRSGDRDVVVLQADAVTTPGWLERMAQYARKDVAIATVSAWSNRGELASFPRAGEDNPVPPFPEAVAEAASAAPWSELPDLPSASGPCVLLRRAAIDQLGSLDSTSYDGERAIDDFCRRAATMGWRNVLCLAAYVVRQPAVVGPGAAHDDLSALVARWPDYQEQAARFILSDPLRSLRDRLQSRIDQLARSGPQRDLFH